MSRKTQQNRKQNTKEIGNYSVKMYEGCVFLSTCLTNLGIHQKSLVSPSEHCFNDLNWFPKGRFPLLSLNYSDHFDHPLHRS